MKVKYKDNFDDKTKERFLSDILNYENLPYYGNDLEEIKVRVENSNNFSLALVELLHAKGVLSDQDICTLCNKIISSIDEDSFKVISE